MPFAYALDLNMTKFCRFCSDNLDSKLIQIERVETIW